MISAICLSPGPDDHHVPLTTVDIELFYRLTGQVHLRTTLVNLETEMKSEMLENLNPVKVKSCFTDCKFGKASPDTINNLENHGVLSS